MKSKTAVGLALGALGVAAAAWVGSGVVIGQRAESALLGLKNGPQGALRITQLNHERSLLGAKGHAELAFQPGCAADAGADAPIALRIDYTMSHLPLPNALTRFDWQASPMSETAAEFKAIFGSVTQLAGHGSVAPGGALRTEMGLPELSVQRSGESLQVAPSTGFLSVNGDALAFGWKVDRLVARGGGQAMEAKNLAIDVDLKNRHLGTGTMELAAAQLSFGAGSLDGLSLKSTAIERGDRLDVSVVPSIRRLQGPGVDLNDLSLELAMKGLDTRSVETLSKLFEASCGMQSLTAAEGRQARDAAVRLLARGLSIGVPKLGAKAADGTVGGQLVVELMESSSGQPSLAAQLRARGHLEVTGTIVPEGARQLAVAGGYAVAKGNALRAEFDYAGGLLRLNERALDGAAVLAGLQQADAQLQTLVGGWAESQTLAARR